MTAYYNEVDQYCASWLRNLIAAGHIAPGDVDTRSIEDVTPSDLAGYTQCHFFAGIGVWSYSLRLAGWPDDRPVWTGSCPCQSFSAAGKGGGFADERHLWPAWHHLISECRPPVVFGEQVASRGGLTWLDLVHADMEGTGYAFAPFDLCAAGVGAPHIRQRLYFVGHADRGNVCGDSRASDGAEETSRHQSDSDNACASGAIRKRARSFWSAAEWVACRDNKSRPVEPGTFPLAHGAPARVGRLRAYGNAIVAPLAKEFIGAYLDGPR